MFNVSRSWKRVTSAVALFAGLIFGHYAHAVSVGASTGYPINKTSAPCWAVSGDRIQYTGNCGPSQTWTMPLVANAGTHSVAISATNNSTLSCFVCEMAQDASRVGCAPTPSFPLSTTSVQSASIAVPTNGGLYVLCFVGQGSAINTLNYTQ